MHGIEACLVKIARVRYPAHVRIIDELVARRLVSESLVRRGGQRTTRGDWCIIEESICRIGYVMC